MKVQKKFLLPLAGMIWFIAGFNIMRIGVIASKRHWIFSMLCLSVVVYLLFHNMVFRKMVKKHTARIINYEDEKQPLYRFFDKQAYCIMALMIALGVSLRVSSLMPDMFIAVFYSGLGFSLIIAGVSFCLQFSRYDKLFEKRSIHGS